MRQSRISVEKECKCIKKSGRFVESVNNRQGEEKEADVCEACAHENIRQFLTNFHDFFFVMNTENMLELCMSVFQ
jgi:hypothetical protein